MQNVEEFMAGLRTGYRDSVRERLATMTALLAAARAQPEDLASLRELRRHVHNLAGSGGTYGFTALSAAAQVGELRLEALLGAGTPFTDADFSGLDQLLVELALLAETDIATV